MPPLKKTNAIMTVMIILSMTVTYLIISRNLILFYINMKNKRLMAATVLAFFLLTALTFSCKSYPPSFDIEKFYTESDDTIDFIEDKSYIALLPKNEAGEYYTENGIIFYPGGLVDYHAYIPLLTRCAENKTACFIVKMPLNFAFMDKQAAGKFLTLYPEINNWYMAGHSLGGAIAASYISRHAKDFKGLILLAAYSTHDISKKNLKVLSLYGSNDKVLNLEHYHKYQKKLPAIGSGLTEIIINGGNHAQFASYGNQDGDGIADISAEEQQSITAAEIASWMELK